MLVVALTLAALVAATLSGMTGLGGGTLLIAVLYAFGLAPAVAVPIHAGVQLTANASRTLAYLAHVDWRGLGLFLIGALPAPFVVAPFATGADPAWVRLGMALFILMALWPDWLTRIRLQGNAGMVVAGAIAGGVGMITGATGLLIAAFFLRAQWSKETVIATMAVCQSLAYLVKIVAFSSFGYGLGDYGHLLLPMAVAAVIGTLLGRRLVGVFDERSSRIAFRLILAALALRLAYDGVAGLHAA